MNSPPQIGPHSHDFTILSDRSDFNYNLRPRRHNLVLTAKSSSITDRDYVTRMIFKNIYWCFPSTCLGLGYCYCVSLYFFTICTLSRCGLSTWIKVLINWWIDWLFPISLIILPCTDRSGISTTLHYNDLFDLVYRAVRRPTACGNVVIAGQLAGLWQRVVYTVMMCPVVLDCNLTSNQANLQAVTSWWSTAGGSHVANIHSYVTVT